MKNLFIIIFTSLFLVNCNNSNPMMKQWSNKSLEFGGVPAFDKMSPELVKEAMLKGMEISLSDYNKIANNLDAPTFENTIEEMERSGKLLSDVYPYYGILSSNMSTPEFRKIQGELAPKLSEYSSKISQNEKLFERVSAIYNSSKINPLEDDQQRVLDLTYKSFAMNGAALNNDKKKRYADINLELSKLYNDFSNNVLNDEENYVTYLDESQLDGLSDAFIKSAKKIAEDKGFENKYAITNTRSSMDPFLTYSTNRALREVVWKNYYSRGDNGDEFDNNEIIAEILRLRKERVGLLGHENYAQWRLQDRMAKNPENAMALMEAVWPAAIARVDEEVADMQEVANKLSKPKITIEPWDYRFYAEKVRKLKYDLDSDEVKQYLQLDKLTDAMFYVAGELFNYKFIALEKGRIPVFHEDVNVWEVQDKSSGEHTNVLASNNSNFVKPAPGEALLVSWDDATTFFHEFGHALHFFASNVKYPTLNSGVRDYTEFQSQLLERWLSTDRVINQFLIHNKTGDPMPKELVDKIKKASTFNQGFETTEYLASAIMDMKFHLTDPSNIDVDKFEKETLDDLKMPSELPMRHRTPHFGHVFSGEGYATAYYGYMWADVLTSDASEAFAEAPGGFYDKDVAKKLVDYLFSPRNSIDPAEAYRLFRGRDAKIEALMRDRGFPFE